MMFRACACGVALRVRWDSCMFARQVGTPRSSELLSVPKPSVRSSGAESLPAFYGISFLSRYNRDGPSRPGAHHVGVCVRS